MSLPCPLRGRLQPPPAGLVRLNYPRPPSNSMGSMADRLEGGAVVGAHILQGEGAATQIHPLAAIPLPGYSFGRCDHIRAGSLL